MDDPRKPEASDNVDNVDPTPHSTPDGDVTPSQAFDPPSQLPSDLEREVADAMASMNPDDLAELCGADTSNESTAPGSELIGRIVACNDDEVFLEFGPKLQGILPRAQVKEGESVEVGQRMSVMIDRHDKEADLLILRRKGAVQRANWDSLAKGMLLEGRVTGLIKGGLEVDFNGIRGFMPVSQASASPMKDVSVLLNERIRCEVIEVERRAKNIVVSRRKLIEREQAQAAEQLKEELAVGQVRKGTVRNITEFGAFVDLGGLEGLVHIRDVSWGTVDKVEDVLSLGQEVEVQVLKIDMKRGRISLGFKQTQPDPWDHAEKHYPVGTTLKVRIVRIAEFGAFAELEPGVEGLIPIREMSWTRVQKTSDVVNPGDMVDVVVVALDQPKRRLSMSIKQVQGDPWEGVLDGFEPNSLAKGTVTRLADFGAFVELIPGVEGLIHISELSDRRVRSCGEVLKVGQEVETRVLGIDKEERRISLSLKQVKAPDQATAAMADANSEPPQPPKKRKKPLRGGLSSHFDW